MATCKWCGNSGFLVRVSDNGMCDRCESTQTPILHRGLEIIQDSLRLVDSGNTLQARVSRCQDIVRVAKELLPYEERGIPTCEPPPSELIPHFEHRRGEILSEHLGGEVKKILSRAESKTTPKSAMTEAEKAIVKIDEARSAYQVDHPDLDELERTVRRFLFQTELTGYLTEAEKAEGQGKKEEARTQYQEALLFLSNYWIDEEPHADRVREIEEKIRALQIE